MIRAANCKVVIKMLRGFGTVALFSLFLTATASAARLELNMGSRFEGDVSCVTLRAISLEEDGYVHWLFSRNERYSFLCGDALVTFAKTSPDAKGMRGVEGLAKDGKFSSSNSAHLSKMVLVRFQ